MAKNSFLPIVLNLRGYKILVVGAGRVAVRKVKTLLEFNGRVSVLAPECDKEIKKWARKKRIKFIKREFSSSDLDEFDMVYACTNNIRLNQKIAVLSAQRHILCNVASDGRISRFISPAMCRDKDIIVAVSSSGKNPPKAVKVRDGIAKELVKILKE